MKQLKSFNRVIGLLLVSLLLLAAAAGCTLGQGTRPGPARPKSSTTKPAPAGQPAQKAKRPAPAKKRLTVLAFYAKDYKWTTAGLPSIEKHAGAMDIIAPFWYSVETDGSVTGKGEPDVTKTIKNKGKKLVVMVNNADTNDAMLKDPAVAQKAVANIAALIANNPYDGVNVDFQLVPPTDRQGYTNFVKSLSETIRPKGKSLGVSVFPPVGLPSDINGVYDYAAVSQYVDYVAIMTYDRHQRSSPPGPVAPITWVEQNIQGALKMIPKDKLFIGIATYGYDWPANKGAEVKDLGTKEIMALVDKHKAKIQWDNTEQEPFFSYTDDTGMSHTVWFESAQAASKRIALAEKYGIGGVAIWRLGFEDPKLWDFIK